MLSRRNVRIKVMQVLYSMSRDTKLSTKNALSNYKTNIEKSFELFIFNILQLTQIASFSIEDAAKKHSKLLPTEEDKLFTAKLGENDLIQSLITNQGLQDLYANYGMNDLVDRDTIRLIYTEFAKKEEYKAYILKSNTDNSDHTQILLDLFKHCIGNELYNDTLEDHFPFWVDDKSLVVGAIKKTIKALPASIYFYENYRPSDETVIEFGENLLTNVCEKDRELRQLIEPTLKNWDAERVAVIDMILLKMALSELLAFPTIPTKVTLNEFVEISKLYSTDKSKDFINGILDRLMKKLHREGRIKKQGRGLID